jgi:hypothetical protein
MNCEIETNYKKFIQSQNSPFQSSGCFFSNFVNTWVETHQKFLRVLNEEKENSYGIKNVHTNYQTSALTPNDKFETELAELLKKRNRQISALLQKIKNLQKKSNIHQEFQNNEKILGLWIQEHDTYIFALFEKERKNLEQLVKNSVKLNKVTIAYSKP